MKKSFRLFLIVCLVIFLAYTVKSANTRNHRKTDVESLLNVESVDKVQDLDKQFTTEKETDNTSTSRIYEKKSLDYISQLNDNFGKKVEVSSNYNIENNTSTNSIDTYSINNKVNEKDLELLSRLVESEAGDEPYAGKLAVASVVINRMGEDHENMDEVIYKSGQFDGVKTSNFYVDPCSDSKKAAQEVLLGHNVVPTAYFFANLKTLKCEDMNEKDKPDFVKIETFIIRIGNHWFFKK